jgi:hypothetical protein
VFIGHFAVAFASKKVAPKVSLGTLVIAAHSESRVRAEPARRYLQVLGVVLAVLHDHAGYPRQALRQIDHGFALADRVGVDAVDRDRKVEAIALRARRGDHY